MPPEEPRPRTAARLVGGQLTHAEAHLARLVTGVGGASWLEAAFRAMQAHFSTAPDGMVRIRSDAPGGRLWATWETLPTTPFPYRLLPMAHPLPPAREPRIKGADGAWHGRVLAAAWEAGAQDALLYWPDGTVAESAIAAVVLEREGGLWIPPAGGRVASLAEALDLPNWIRERRLAVEVRPFDLAAVGEGTLWCLNAVRGMWQAKSIAPIPPMDRMR